MVTGNRGSDKIKMSAMIVQRRPEGLAEGEYRYGFSEYEEGRLIGAAMRAKQHRLQSKSNQPSVLASGAILEGKAGMSFICPWW